VTKTGDQLAKQHKSLSM